MSQEVIDLTIEEQQPALVSDADTVIETTVPVMSLMLTYPRILDQLERAGVELMDNGMLKYWDQDQLCQCSSIKDFFLIHLLQVDPQPAYIIVAQENHRDDTPHIHCFLQWVNHRHRFPMDHFDFHGMHPNIQMINRPEAAKRYVRKEDLNYLSWVKCIYIDSEDEGFFPHVLPPYEE